MNLKDKKFQEAIKFYDNKDYKEAKRACDKMLEKQPDNGDVLSLKGLVMLSLNEKEEGKRLINSAIKLNMKNPVAWHFYALFNKEIKNYAQCITCYSQSLKYDSKNTGSLRDLSYLQLFMRKYADFCKSSRIALDLRPNILLNWITCAFGYFLIENYPAAIGVIESCENIGKDTFKKSEKHELVLFKTEILLRMNKHKEAIQLLLTNEGLICDKAIYHEKIITIALLTGQKEIGIEHCNKAFEINSENVNYFIWYFNLKLGKEINITTYDDILSLQENHKYLKEMNDILHNDLKRRLKSRIITRLELAMATGETFRDLFNDYFNKNIKINIPSFFSNIKFIYYFQAYKLKIIEDILSKHLTSITSSNCLDKSLTKGEILNLNTHIVWVYFFASYHYDTSGDLETALKYINLAIDNTPSVVEFYMAKSRILKHGLMFNECGLSYHKAKTLDMGDRYLNAKYAKCIARDSNITRSCEIMEEFVRKPLLEESMNHFQNMWYEYECGNGFLQNGQFLNAHRVIQSILNHFNEITQEQNDFYNYSLRKYMINDLNAILTFMDKMYRSKYAIKAMYMLDLIREVLIAKGESCQSELMKEYDEIKTNYAVKQYTFTTLKELIEGIEKDIINFSCKVQELTQCAMGQFICLKYFIINKKTLRALKSLLFLKENSKNNQEGLFYYSEGHKYFMQYYKENCEKMNLTIAQVIKEKYGSLLEVNTIEWQESDLFIQVQNELYSNGNFNDEKRNGDLIKKILTIERNILRKSKNIRINELITKVTLYTNVVFKEQFKKDLIMKLKINAEEKDLKGNLTFWQEKNIIPFNDANTNKTHSETIEAMP